MLGILLVMGLLALSLAAYLIRGQREHFRESVLIGFILWGSGILVSTEALNIFHVLGSWEILVFWTVILALCLVIIIRKWANISDKGLFYPSTGLNAAGTDIHWLFLEKTFLNRIIFFSFCLGVIALIAPPNTFDAMTYHLSRVMHWIQDHSLAYYPTDVPRQLYMPNFSEYIILHFRLLSGGDYWANSVQWLSMCGSLVGVSLIAKELGAAGRGQVLSALIAVTIPMGVLQATSTQTDYVGTLWLCGFIYFFLCWRRNFGWKYSLLVGLSLGLAISTKGVVLIFAVPFLGWMLIEAVSRFNVKIFQMIGIVVCVAALFYTGTFYRNTAFFHGNASRVLSADADSLINTRICWEGFLSNALRNTGLHVSTPWKSLNNRIENGIYGLASQLHLDLNHKDWSYMGSQFKVIAFTSDEDATGNLLHLLLYTAVLLLFMIFSRFRSFDSCVYLAVFLIGWISFNVILKWQPWHSRFHLPMFVIFAPIAGLVIEKIRFKWIVSGIMGSLFISAWFFVFLNTTKPLFSGLSIFNPQNRPGLYFMRVEPTQETFLEYVWMGFQLRKMGCKNIGLMTGSDELEYLLWIVLNPSSDHSMRIEDVLVNNASGALKYPLGDFVPDAIIAFNDDRLQVNLENNIYQVVWHNELGGKKVSILMKRTS